MLHNKVPASGCKIITHTLPPPLLALDQDEISWETVKLVKLAFKLGGQTAIIIISQASGVHCKYSLSLLTPPTGSTYQQKRFGALCREPPLSGGTPSQQCHLGHEKKSSTKKMKNRRFRNLLEDSVQKKSAPRDPPGASP